eukprot:17972-Heterococcus_DN1.PRE.1
MFVTTTYLLADHVAIRVARLFDLDLQCMIEVDSKPLSILQVHMLCATHQAISHVKQHVKQASSPALLCRRVLELVQSGQKSLQSL